MNHELAERLENVGKPRVLVFGDLILDRYVFGAVERISPEAPIQVLAVRREESRIGGAGNVACNVHALGARVDLVGAVGDDAAGRELRAEVATFVEDADAIFVDPSRPTSEKTRMVASAQQVLRVDREDARPIGSEIEAKVVESIERRVAQADLVVVSDYGKGFLTDAVLRRILDACRAHDRRVLVDPKGRDFEKYRGASLVTPNRLEAEQVTGLVLDSPEALAEAGRKLTEDLDLEAALVTLGGEGMYLHPCEGEPFRVAAQARAVYDVTGAGDTVVASLAVMLGGGVDLRDAIRIANAAAGVVVGKLGTALVTRREILARLREGMPYHTAKDVPLDELADRLAAMRDEGRRVVFTNGCFDLVHAGHIHFLEFARAQGDCLVVGLNADSSIRELKGEGRPIQMLRERKRVLGALEMVDFVVAFEESTPIALIERLRPDVLVKGEDWRAKGVVGREVVEGYGGRVVLAPLVEGLSTTGIVERIAARCGESRPSSEG